MRHLRLAGHCSRRCGHAKDIADERNSFIQPISSDSDKTHLQHRHPPSRRLRRRITIRPADLSQDNDQRSLHSVSIFAARVERQQRAW
jgi:hypothetical protein